MGKYTIFYMFENPRRGMQARNFTANVPKILDLKSSSEQIFFRKLSLGAPDKLTGVHRLLSLLRLVKTIATWKTVMESMQSLGMDNFRVAYTPISRFLFGQSFWTSRWRNADENGKVRQVSPLTPRPKLNGRQNF